MGTYKFETDQFGITDKGIHLLRSRFNYQTIEFDTVDEIILEKGKQIANWFVAFIIGIVFFFGGSYLIGKVFHTFLFVNTHHVFSPEQILLPILPMFLGAYAIYFSLKVGFVLKISVKDRTRSLPIEQLKKKNQIGELIHYFNAHEQLKNKLTVNFARPVG